MTRVVRLSGNDPWCNVYVLGEEGGPCIFFDFGAQNGANLLSYAEKHHSADYKYNSSEYSKDVKRL